MVIHDYPTFAAQGACRDADADLFFEAEGERGYAKTVRAEKAKAICSGCDVRRECLRWALDKDEQHGVAGGATAEERRAWKATHGPEAVAA